MDALIIQTVSKYCPMRDGMTISRSLKIPSENALTWFSLGRQTEISQERYDNAAFYIGAEGCTAFHMAQKSDPQLLLAGSFLFIPSGTLCGPQSEEGAVYMEIIMRKEPEIMNEKIVPGKALELKSLIDYEEDCVVNLDIVKNKSLRYVLMAFDKNTGLQPHRAPGDAIVTALEGSAVIGYEGKDYELKEGESFRLAKNALHSVSALDGRFKMSLLLVLA